MRDNYYLDEELFDKIEDDSVEGKGDKKALRSRKILKAIKIALYAILGETGARLFYKSSNEKSKNTDYIDRF